MRCGSFSNKLLPGRVGIWTSAHDVRGKSRDVRADLSAPKFGVEELRKYAVVVVTHSFYGAATHIMHGTFGRADTVRHAP